MGNIFLYLSSLVLFYACMHRKIWLDNVRIPREHMLDAQSQVDADGTYTSAVSSKRGRFLAVAGGLPMHSLKYGIVRS